MLLEIVGFGAIMTLCQSVNRASYLSHESLGASWPAVGASPYSPNMYNLCSSKGYFVLLPTFSSQLK